MGLPCASPTDHHPSTNNTKKQDIKLMCLFTYLKPARVDLPAEELEDVLYANGSKQRLKPSTHAC